MTLSFVSIAVVAFLLGVFLVIRRARALTGIAPASRLRRELELYAASRDGGESGQPVRPAIESPWHIGEKKVGPIPAVLFEKLNRVSPSRDGEMLYYPCRVVTRDGRVFDRVYVQPRQPYLSHWGILPFNDPHKGWIATSEIVDLEESAFRLPPDLAGQIYEKGETGMGVTRFRVVFRDGTSLAVMTGNAVDFIPLPAGVTGADALHAFPLTGWDEQTELAPRYYWSIYEGVEPT